MAGISDLARHDKDGLVFILDNETTAMTGQHPTPGNETDLLGRPAKSQDIKKVVRGIVGPKVPVVEVDPGDEYAYRKTTEELLLRVGVKHIGYLHFCDTDGTLRDGGTSKHLPCGEGHVNCAKSLQILRDGGFRGWIMVDEWEIPDTYEACRKCKAVIDTVGQR